MEVKCSEKEEGDPIKVNEFFLKIFDKEEENALCIPVAFTIPKTYLKNLPKN